MLLVNEAWTLSARIPTAPASDAVLFIQVLWLMLMMQSGKNVQSEAAEE